MIVSPKIRGFICITAHPAGCAENVRQQIHTIKQQAPIQDGPKNVLVIGASTGYGLASRIVSAFGAKAKTLGVFFEKPASGKRTASAGWYNTAAFEQEAQAEGRYAKSINGDAFSDEIKAETIETIKRDLDKIDLVVYSLASPRRTDPTTGATYHAALKPIGQSYTNKTVNAMTGEISDVTLAPATEEEIAHTVKVMGGEDWLLWIDALHKAGVLADGVLTVAYSYIGPNITYPIYYKGTIGRAKENLEASVKPLNQTLNAYKGRALIAVCKGLVTQASAAIPVVPLYLSLLYKVMKAKGLHEGCIEQMSRLFTDRLYDHKNIPLDEKGRIRIDDWELRDDIQAEIAKIWPQMTTENITELTDIEGYRRAFHQLFGFGFDTIDYEKDVDIDVPIPSLTSDTVHA